VNRQPAQPVGLGVIYQCPECKARYIGERRCPDCHLFTRRADTGGYCPHCDEPVTIADLADSTTQPATEVMPMR
jgi:hypothetical protein